MNAKEMRFEFDLLLKIYNNSLIEVLELNNSIAVSCEKSHIFALLEFAKNLNIIDVVEYDLLFNKTLDIKVE